MSGPSASAIEVQEKGLQRGSGESGGSRREEGTGTR